MYACCQPNITDALPSKLKVLESVQSVSPESLGFLKLAVALDGVIKMDLVRLVTSKSAPRVFWIACVSL
jgi:hypothetical protein